MEGAKVIPHGDGRTHVKSFLGNKEWDEQLDPAIHPFLTTPFGRNRSSPITVDFLFLEIR